MNVFNRLVASPRQVRRQRGQVMILFALAAILVLAMVAIAVDGGYGLVQFRRAQNAADFASVAGTSQLKGLCGGTGNPPANSVVYQSIQYVIDRNASSVGSNWTGQYLDSNGTAITGKYVTQTGYPPTNACGVSVQVNPSWVPFIAQLLGYKSLSSTATAKSVLNPAQGNPVGIVAVDQVSPHQVLGGGTGSFNVYGTIFANSSVPYDPWTELRNNYNYVDVVDAKDGSSLILHGIMESVAGNNSNGLPNWPLDWCFGANADGSDNNNLYNNPDSDAATDKSSGENDLLNDTDGDEPFNTPLCKGGTGSNSVTLKDDQIINNQAQITDPLLSGSGVPDPFDKNAGAGSGYYGGLCPGQSSPNTISVVPPAVGGVTTLQPGDYTVPVTLTGSVDFADCINYPLPGTYDATPATSGAYPGVFRFEKGLSLLPASGTTVRGNNVMIATAAPVTLPGNVPGSGSPFVASGTGNGAPCFPGVGNDGTNPVLTQASGGKAETDNQSAHKCGGTGSLPHGPYYGVITYSQPSPFGQDPNVFGTGTNFSLVLGGQGTITLTAPLSGPYRNIALFQKRATTAPTDSGGNFGLDARPGDKATITITGLVYNVSLPCYGWPQNSDGTCTNKSNYKTNFPNNPFDFWDVGTTFHTGGTLQAGLGIGSNYPSADISVGSVTVNGACVVSDFNTDGNTTITIDGRTNTYQLPGVLGSGNPPIAG